MLKSWLNFTAILLSATTGLFAQNPPRVQTFPLHDTAGLIAPNVKTEAVNYLGRKSVRITMEGEDHEGLALLPGTDFQDGVIEADIALKTTVPPGVRHPGFVGIAFRVGLTRRITSCSTCGREIPRRRIRRCEIILCSTAASPASGGIDCVANGLRCMSLTRTWQRRRGRKCGLRLRAAARSSM